MWLPRHRTSIQLLDHTGDIEQMSGRFRAHPSTSKERKINALAFVSRVACSIIFVQLAIGAPLRAEAQEETEAPDRWKVSAEFSFTDQSGNRVLRLLTGGFSVSHLQRDFYRLDSSFQSRYGRTDGELVTLSHTASFAFDFRPTSTWSPFVFADAERDEFKRLDVRLSSGAGAKHTFRRSANGGLETSLSASLLHSFEQTAAQVTTRPQHPLLPGPSPARVYLSRWSFRGRTSHELRDGVTLRHTTMYQPAWSEMADYLLRSDTGLKILLTERLALSVEYQFKRDSQPPENVGPDDRLLTTGLIIDF